MHIDVSLCASPEKIQCFPETWSQTEGGEEVEKRKRGRRKERGEEEEEKGGGRKRKRERRRNKTGRRGRRRESGGGRGGGREERMRRGGWEGRRGGGEGGEWRASTEADLQAPMLPASRFHKGEKHMRIYVSPSEMFLQQKAKRKTLNFEQRFPLGGAIMVDCRGKTTMKSATIQSLKPRMPHGNRDSVSHGTIRKLLSLPLLPRISPVSPEVHASPWLVCDSWGNTLFLLDHRKDLL